MKKVVFTILSAFTIGLAQANEKELLKKTEEAVKKLQDEKLNGWVKKGRFTFLDN